ncbi:MAG: T9SS type A sorting domain-containing protein [Lentimicrobium sp.]|jgi:hypothetical protein|nr:T9SS type A sorting domain-containing protein [Lentimicrobium sp.]
MKTFAILLSSFALWMNVSAQTVLTYENHAILPGSDNVMKLTDCPEPGVAGKNVVWDFTQLERKADFEGTSGRINEHPLQSMFPEANVIVEEFGNHFFFHVDEKGIEQYGYLDKNEDAMIAYDVPFVKMKFPFSYGDAFNGNYQGAIAGGCSNGIIKGTYSTQADGLGTLLLPDDVTYDNVLRVKEIRMLTQTVNDTATHYGIITYRWFIDENAYPILTLIQKTFNYANGSSDSSTQAAYNAEFILRTGSPVALNSIAASLKFKAYPNPSTDIFNIEFVLTQATRVNLSVYHLNGSLIKELAQQQMTEGKHSFSFSADKSGLAKGAYLLKLRVNEAEASIKMLRQ